MSQSVESEIRYSIQGTSPRAADKSMMKPLQTLLQIEELEWRTKPRRSAAMPHCHGLDCNGSA